LQIELKNISKSFIKDKIILDNISLSISDGEFVVFLGPSGCGKTTLLRIIAGLENEDTGDIFFDNKRINDFDPKDRSIGMVFQNYALYPHLTVYDNIAFPLKISKESKTKIKTRVEEVADFIGLSEYLTYKPKEISGGQRQRVALGRAIARNPKIFLFDEPLSNLDAKLRSLMRTELYSLHRKLETTSIYVTHDQVEAMTMGDKIVVMNNGILQQVDTPVNIYENPANLFVATFIGSPQINKFKCNYTEFENGFKINLLTNKSEEKAIQVQIGNSVVNISDVEYMCIRPENMALEPAFANSAAIGKFEIYSIEFMGNETIVYFMFDDEIKALRTSRNLNAQRGDEVEIYINCDKLLLFDKLENKII